MFVTFSVSLSHIGSAAISKQLQVEPWLFQSFFAMHWPLRWHIKIFIFCSRAHPGGVYVGKNLGSCHEDVFLRILLSSHRTLSTHQELQNSTNFVFCFVQWRCQGRIFGVNVVYHPNHFLGHPLEFMFLGAYNMFYARLTSLNCITTKNLYFYSRAYPGRALWGERK